MGGQLPVPPSPGQTSKGPTSSLCHHRGTHTHVGLGTTAHPLWWPEPSPKGPAPGAHGGGGVFTQLFGVCGHHLSMALGRK